MIGQRVSAISAISDVSPLASATGKAGARVLSEPVTVRLKELINDVAHELWSSR